MNKEMLNYFKGEREFYEFALIQLTGEARKDLLKITRACYTIKKCGEKWYTDIRSKITDERAIEKLEQIYNEMC